MKRNVLGLWVYPVVGLVFALHGCGGGSSNNGNAAIVPVVAPAAATVARRWNDIVIQMIRTDRARPPVQARNLFHVSAAMYDAWAAFDKTAATYLLGTSVQGFSCPLALSVKSQNVALARDQAISYAAYRMIKHRYSASPGFATSILMADQLMAELGLDTSLTDTAAVATSAPALGNYIANCYINYGLQDGANEALSYTNQFYKPVNIALIPANPGDPFISNLDRWQPLDLLRFEDQNGNVVGAGGAEFIGAEWGRVLPFALPASQKTVFSRKNVDYPVYHDPGRPPSFYDASRVDYEWSFLMVAKWAAYLDPNDGVTIDISPATLGNTNSLPIDLAGHRRFYDEIRGGVSSAGYALNPATRQPYSSQVVPRGDYARVIAEYWADGPDSETPPGHWFAIWNNVMQHPQFKRRYRGSGEELDRLEWDVKSYFMLGGALHDAAIAAWGIKGWYDTVRPISAIRAMAALGQRTHPDLPGYDSRGLPLIPGSVELVGLSDPLAGPTLQGYGKIKLWTWRGPTYVADPAKNTAGVGWILAENWWPFQKATFVTPPFAGYVSGHSTFSRAAAEVLTVLTGDPFFPGGLASYAVKKDTFLRIERGPSVDMTLQWATYRDAADQSAVSRIWGGIHPSIDDVPGRRIGATVGLSAVDAADRYFAGFRP
jgi:hypothetical protein